MLNVWCRCHAEQVHPHSSRIVCEKTLQQLTTGAKGKEKQVEVGLQGKLKQNAKTTTLTHDTDSLAQPIFICQPFSATELEEGNCPVW